MSTSAEMTKTGESSLTKAAIELVRYYFGGRRGLILLTIAILGAGLVVNWSWLVAVGIAPLLLALAPCAVMCALGLCMNKMMGGKSCSTQSDPADRSTGTSASSTATTAKVHDEPLAAAIEPAISSNDATHERS